MSTCKDQLPLELLRNTLYLHSANVELGGFGAGGELCSQSFAQNNASKVSGCSELW